MGSSFMPLSHRERQNYEPGETKILPKSPRNVTFILGRATRTRQPNDNRQQTPNNNMD